jgi:CBS-domain-containing membrane protein
MTEPERTGADEPRVADIMVTDVVTVTPDMGVKEFAELMRDKGIGGAPVVNDKDELVGMVTEGDLMALDADLHFPHYVQFLDSVIYLESGKKFEERLKKAVAATVGEVMTPEVHAVGPADPVRKVAHETAHVVPDSVEVDLGKGALAAGQDPRRGAHRPGLPVMARILARGLPPSPLRGPGP